MDTNQLISILSRGAGPAPTFAVPRRLIPVSVAGLLASVFLSASLLGLLSAESFLQPVTWVKLGYALSLALAAGLLTAALAKPVSRLARPSKLLIAVVAAMVTAGVLALALSPSNERISAVFGQTWLSCSWTLMAFSLPALLGILVTLRTLAPTRLRQAGWASGFLAGGLGALGYALACPESSPTFVAIWYTLGILLTGLIGRLIAPMVLRW
ncbi:MAG: NrsF family protein [Burkholderiaceae bacterium]|jgi:hypothetical protein